MTPIELRPIHRSISTISGEQIRAGRALARIDQVDLAKRCGLSLETIKRLEGIRGAVGANSRTIQALFGAFATIGIRFERGEDGGEGVCLASPDLLSLPAVRPSASSDGAPARLGDGSRCHRLIYFGAANPAAPEPLHQRLENVRVCGTQQRAALKVTGMVYAYSGRFLGILEGAKDDVWQVFGSISCDARNNAISVVSDLPASARRFHDWTISCGLFASDAAILGDEPALREGFHPEALSPTSALGLVTVIRDLAEESPRKALHSRVPCPLARICLDRVCAQDAA